MKKLENAKKFVKEHALSITLCATGTAALCAGYILYGKALSTKSAAYMTGFTEGATAGVSNVLVWAAGKAPDANLPELWDSELKEVLKKIGITVAQP